MTTRALFLFFIYMISIVSNGVSETIPDDKLLRILITPNRFQTKLNQTASNIIVIDKTDIENSNSNSLSEILDSQAGISSGNQGGVGQTSSYFIQGFEKKYISILIDGVSYADNTATQSETYLNSISLDEIERIEILKGPQGAIYGSSAAGGVISIITKGNSKKGMNTSFQSNIGSYGTASSTLNTGYSAEKWDLNLSVNGLHSDGFSAKNAVEEEENDSFNSIKTSLKGSIKNDNNLRVSGTLRQIDSKTQIDAYTTNDFNKLRQTAGSIKIEKKINKIDSFIQLTKQRTVRQFIGYQYYGDTFNFDFLNQYNISSNHNVTMGFEYDDEKYNDKTLRADKDRHSFVTGFNGNLNNNVGYDFSLREENDSTYGSQKSTRTEAYYLFNPSLRLALSNSTGFRNPSLYETFDSTYGTRTLTPETTETKRISISGQTKIINGGYSLNAYKSKISNLIASASGTYIYYNADGDTNISGIEGNINSKLGQKLFSNFGFVTTHKKTSDNKKNILLPRYSISGSLNYIFNKDFNLNTNLSYSEGAYDTSKVELPSYTLVGLKANYKINNKTKFNLSVVNVFDEDYVVNRGYNTSGRALYLGFKSEF
ncbi:TonB-dependent receptor [Alphaproteobacteria bacterium]|nr:TonB-dependent receptor [Alphaproteobacteria bacterium]